MPPEIVFSRDGFAELARWLTAHRARKVLILAAPSRRYVDRAVAALTGFEVDVFDGARVHVPREVVDAAAARLAATGADTIVAVGGGSPVGLGKALRLTHDVRFAAVPTTYAGSEMTSIYGITTGAEKTTGRDPKVKPDLVVYHPGLTADLPIGLTVQSLFNALAHVASTIGAGSLDGDDRARALATAGAVTRAIEDLLIAPGAARPREAAQRAAAAAGEAADRGRFGFHHGLAHLLGGGLGLDHAALHALLLPHSIAHLRATAPALVDELARAIGVAEPEPYLHDLLVRAGAPVSLAALGADADAVERVLATRPELPAAVALDALHGLRPPGRGGRLDLGVGPAALLAGPSPATARRVVVVVHGRGAEAGTLVRRFVEIAGHDPGVAVVGLRADADRWYAIRYSEPGAGADAEVVAAIDRVHRSLAALGIPPERLVLAGFSQGACLILEYAARHPAPYAAIVASCGGRIGAPSEWAPPAAGALAGVPILIGAATGDRWIAPDSVDATAGWLRGAGAAVESLAAPGDRHEITLLQRIAARALVTGRAAPAAPRGLGNTHELEALAGALPPRQNSPRRARHGLYPEQLNATGFTAPRATNLRTWCYRVRPSAQRRAFAPLPHPRFGHGFEGRPPAIDLVGLPALAIPDEPADFLDGLVTLGGAGSAALRRGYAVHRYAANRDMSHRACYDADGDLLVIPDRGALTIVTELGVLAVRPGAIALIPAGLTWSIFLDDGAARGYVAETFGRHLALPERGPIGANGLADPRHFRGPTPYYEDRLAPGFEIVAKLGGALHRATQDHAPFDVVAWHGNLAPHVYDLDDFSPVSSVRFDHADPSVFTVLSAPLDEAGAHGLDFLAFPPRWDVTEGTFRPPFFHRNVTCEINGIVREPDDPRFPPGSCFITPPFTAHGVGGDLVEKIRGRADADADRPFRLGVDSLWFQLESALPLALTPWSEAARTPDWASSWSAHRSWFAPE